MATDRLSPLDATFLHVEDPVSHMHMGSVGIFEGPPPPYQDLLDMVAAKLELVPRYRQVVRRVPLDLGRPVWVDDQHFHLEYHLRRTALPPPGGEAELRRLVGRVMSQPLDRAKPLWEIWMVEGLEEGSWALVSKTHHAMVDGVSGTELLSVIFDLTPDAVVPRPGRWEPSRVPGPVGLAAGAMADMARSPYEQLRVVRARTRVPRQALAQAADVARGLTSLAGTLRPTPTSSLNGPIGPHRRYAWAEATVADVKRIRQGLGGSFNDVVLAAITGGFRALLRHRGEPVDRVVRSMVPVSVRARDASGLAIGDGSLANRVSAMFAELPVDIEDPVERLRTVTERMGHLKESRQAVAAEALTSLGGFTPPAVLAMAMRVATKTPQRNVTTVTTNVPGPQVPLYVLGRRMLKAFPYVPLAGQVRVGVAIFSYNGAVTFGVTGDYDTASDIEVLCQGIEDTVAAMLKKAAPARGGARTRARAKAASAPDSR